jgi:hypothetical protein
MLRCPIGVYGRLKRKRALDCIESPKDMIYWVSLSFFFLTMIITITAAKIMTAGIIIARMGKSELSLLSVLTVLFVSPVSPVSPVLLSLYVFPAFLDKIK